MKSKTVSSSLAAGNGLVTKPVNSDHGFGGDAAMIDWQRVRDLRSEVGADGFDEVVALFLEEADQAVARLSLTGSMAVLAADLHFLKSAALNLGFTSLSILCQDGERRVGSGDKEIDLDAVRNAYANCRATFEAGVATAFAA